VEKLTEVKYSVEVECRVVVTTVVLEPWPRVYVRVVLVTTVVAE
jgi:hypothetical protein